jgi:4-carboxymuconolactone decarboxylase
MAQKPAQDNRTERFWRALAAICSCALPGGIRFTIPPRGASRVAANQAKGIAMNKELFDKGLAIRKSVIGAEFVDKALASADDFNMPLQELVTEYCWGAVWGREGLEKKTRSLLNIAMLSTLNRPHELKVHVKGAIRNGASKEEIRETLLQVAIYAGVPAAVDSFRVAKEALAEIAK